MPPTARAAFWRRAVMGYAGFGASLAYCIVRVAHRGLLGARAGANESIAKDTARVMARLVCAGGDIRVRVIDGERMTQLQPCVYVANHQSFVDYPILATIFPARTVIVGKAEIGRIPLIGWLFRVTGNVLLARANGRGAADTLTELVKAIVRDGQSIWMFPEGTRRRTAEPMLPFKSGAFRVAAAAGVPIVPVVVSSLTPHIDLATRQAEPTTITIRVLTARAVDDDEAHIRTAVAETRDAMVLAFCEMSPTQT